MSTRDPRSAAGPLVTRRWPTAGSVMDVNRGNGPRFNRRRTGLPLGVLGSHSAIVAEPHSLDLFDWKHPLFACILPMFVGLSGFLVTGSAVRLLLPASGVVIAVAALSWHLTEKPALWLTKVSLRAPPPFLAPADEAALGAAWALETVRV